MTKLSISASQPLTSSSGVAAGPANVKPYAPGDNRYMDEILRLRRIIHSRDEKTAIDKNTMEEYMCEINELSQQIRNKEASLQADVIRATMRQVSGLKSADKASQCMPHDMSAAYRRTFEYGVPWQRSESGVYWVDWAIVEAERVGNHPEDPPVPKLTSWVRSYDHRPGDLAPPSQVQTDAQRMPPPGTIRGGRGGRIGRGMDRGGRPSRHRRYSQR